MIICDGRSFCLYLVLIGIFVFSDTFSKEAYWRINDEQVAGNSRTTLKKHLRIKLASGMLATSENLLFKLYLQTISFVSTLGLLSHLKCLTIPHSTNFTTTLFFVLIPYLFPVTTVISFYVPVSPTKPQWVWSDVQSSEAVGDCIKICKQF